MQDENNKHTPTTFHAWVKKTFTWVDNDVKRYMQRAWTASTQARNILDKQETKILKQQNEELTTQLSKERADRVNYANAVEALLKAEMPNSKAQEPFINHLLTKLKTLTPTSNE